MHKVKIGEYVVTTAPPPINKGIVEGDSSKGVVEVELLEALDGLI